MSKTTGGNGFGGSPYERLCPLFSCVPFRASNYTDKRRSRAGGSCPSRCSSIAHTTESLLLHRCAGLPFHRSYMSDRLALAAQTRGPSFSSLLPHRQALMLSRGIRFGGLLFECSCPVFSCIRFCASNYIDEHRSRSRGMSPSARSSLTHP